MHAFFFQNELFWLKDLIEKSIAFLFKKNNFVFNQFESVIVKEICGVAMIRYGKKSYLGLEFGAHK